MGFSSLLAAGALGLSIASFRESPLSSLHYLLYLLTQIVLLHLTYLNHHTARASSTLVLLFWPAYLFISAIRFRTMVLIGDFSATIVPLVIARESLWIVSIVVGMMDFLLELFGPEKRWKRFTWRSEGKIKLDDEEDEEVDGVDGLNGGGSVPGKNEYGEPESPVLTANIYER